MPDCHYIVREIPVPEIVDNPSCGMVIRALEINGKCYAVHDLNKNLSKIELVRFKKSIDRVAKYGKNAGKRFFSKLKDNLWEIKHIPLGIRLFGFFDRDQKTFILYNLHKKSTGGHGNRDRTRSQSSKIDACHEMKKVYYELKYSS